jgi:integrase
MSRTAQEQYRFWKHSNGTIYIVWNERIELASGHFHTQTRRVSTGTTDWQAAEKFRSQFIARLDNPPPPQEPTIAYLLDRYKQERGAYMRAPEALKNGLLMLLPFFGNLLPSHVTNQLFRQFAEKHKHLSPSTIVRRLGILKAALRYAEGNRWIAPLPPLRMPVSGSPPRDIWLTRVQVAKLLDNAKSDHISLFIKMAVFTGARSGAILELTWQQVDFENRIINYGKGWGNKKRAVVPINDELMAALQKARSASQTDYVIEFSGKGVMSIKAAFRRLCQDCGIKASPHVLRHTAATWLVMEGVPLREVARLLGNSEAMVEKVYGKHSPDYLRRAVSALNLNKPETLQL